VLGPLVRLGIVIVSISSHLIVSALFPRPPRA
jgi:hypothetical protein